MDCNHERNGRFGPGNRANPNGRPRRKHSMLEEVSRELSAKVMITENGKRKRVSKLAANAKQIANQGASGELKAAKMTMDLALKADRERGGAPPVPILTENDRAIVMRFIDRLKFIVPNKEDGDADA